MAYCSQPRALLMAVVLSAVLPWTLAFAAIPVYFDSTNYLHRDLQYHPEIPERITACLEALEMFRQKHPGSIELIDIALDQTAIASPSPFPESTHSPFSDEELKHARDMLLQVHDKDLVVKLEDRCRRGKQQRLEEGKPALGHMGYMDPDTYVTTETFDVCLRATAAWIRACNDHCNNDNNNDSRVAMALTRPPGHHATRTSQNGFCFFNFAAAATAHVLAQNPTAKVSVLDWDVHYGQGVADILQDEPRSRYVSIHQSPAFPFMGNSFQVFGPHKNIMTIPISMDTTWTCGYEERYKQALQFICQTGEWEPDVVIISAGYDALGSDELASVSLNAEDYWRMTRMLIQHLEDSLSVSRKRPRIVIGLEGGYQLKPAGDAGNLPDAVVQTVRALVES